MADKALQVLQARAKLARSRAAAARQKGDRTRWQRMLAVARAWEQAAQLVWKESRHGA